MGDEKTDGIILRATGKGSGPGRAIHFRILGSRGNRKYELIGDHRRNLHYKFPNIELWEGDAGARRLAMEIIDGEIFITGGTVWDGPSYVAIDTANWMWASLVHDMLYRAIVAEVLPFEYHRIADNEMWKILKEEHMRWWRRGYSWLVVRIFSRWVAKRRIRRKKGRK